jgi:hypothetical protein
MCTAKNFIMAGYSETPLLKKLGITEQSRIFLIQNGVDYNGITGTNLDGQIVKNIANADFFHVFVRHKKDLEKHFRDIIALAKADAVIWISWYKKTAKIPTDVTEGVIREVVLPTGWVDVKVCAVSDVWSGLKIVKRLKNR